MGWRLRGGFSHIAGTRRKGGSGGEWGWRRRLMAVGWWFGFGGFVLLRRWRWFKCGFQTRRRRRQCGEALQERFANFLCLSKFASVGATCWNALLGLLLPRLSDEPVRPAHADTKVLSQSMYLASGRWGRLVVYFGISCGFARTKVSQLPPPRSKRTCLWPGMLARGRRPTRWWRRWA